MKNIPSDAESRLEQDDKMKVHKKAIAQLKIHQENLCGSSKPRNFLTLNFCRSWYIRVHSHLGMHVTDCFHLNVS